jgi:endonuclease I
MVMERTSVSLLLVAVTASFSLSNAQESSHAFNFDGCDVTEYYAKLSSTDASKWNRNEVQGLLQATHRHSLLYTNTETPGVDDVWAALMDVDVGTVPDTVQLLYGPTAQMEAIPFGQRTWIKEHVHPVLGLVETDSNTSLADGDLGKDITDMHNIFPASVLSETVRAQKYFGECGYLTESPQLCQQPAEGSSEGTCSCQDVYTPPEDKKGDIARALMYMDLRYDGSDPMTVDLKLSDPLLTWDISRKC